MIACSDGALPRLRGRSGFQGRSPKRLGALHHFGESLSIGATTCGDATATSSSVNCCIALWMEVWRVCPPCITSTTVSFGGQPGRWQAISLTDTTASSAKANPLPRPLLDGVCPANDARRPARQRFDEGATHGDLLAPRHLGDLLAGLQHFRNDLFLLAKTSAMTIPSRDGCVRCACLSIPPGIT